MVQAVISNRPDKARQRPRPGSLREQRVADTDGPGAWLRRLCDHRILTAPEEIALAKRVEAGVRAQAQLNAGVDLPTAMRCSLRREARDGRAAKDEFVLSNVRLVVNIARRYTRPELPLEDLLQEGVVGLTRAVERFDWRLGFRFSTYAVWWVRQAIGQAAADHGRMIRAPAHMLERLQRLKEADAELEYRLGRAPTPAELAVELDEPLGVVEQQLGYLLRTARPLALELPLDDDGFTLADALAGPDDPEAAALRRVESAELLELVAGLPERERAILEWRFGLVDGTPRTLEEIGRDLGLTRERIRQLEARALRSLRAVFARRRWQIAA